MSIETPSDPADSANPETISEPISGAIPRSGEFADESTCVLWEELRELARSGEAIHVKAAQVAGALARAQAAQDLARQNDLIARGRLAPRHRKSAADLLAEASACVQDTAIATLGGPVGLWAGRIAVGVAPDSIAAPVREAVDAGAITFAQGAALVHDIDTPEVDPDAGQKVCDAVLAYAAAKSAATGAPVGQGVFCPKKRREMVRHVSTPRRRARAIADRAAWVSPGDDGIASIGVTGADARCLGAYRRVDAIARTLRAQGDGRTLTQLRSDVAVDLLLYGQPSPDAPTSVDHPGVGGWPAAVVTVVVSAASLQGLNDEPGLVEGHPVAADTVRDVAFAAGSTWRRLVAEPLTGYAMADVSPSYKPPPRMARAVRDRDGICRAPGCHIPAARCQLDHVIEVRDGGTTRADTLADECEPHHTKKTRRHWAAHITPDGVIEWHLPDGKIYSTFPMDYRELGLDPDQPDKTEDAVEPNEVSEPGEPGEPGEHASPADDAGKANDTGHANGTGGASGHGLGDANGQGDAGDPQRQTRRRRTRDRVLIDRADLEALDTDALAHQRELDGIRALLADEETAHAHTRATLEALRAEHPPF
ncbi:HNH endonuclease signature motif containing protein [Piscicoccus intestinalis]|uniref:HNH endonuclease signature motif containing protein n=1 Tax=Piscicoccus intestinalis TaxID=746033 RepID=UPI0012ED9FB9|nr:HNH endonuclease signature motif containing protein [Piscicoccus intestinalis]